MTLEPIIFDASNNLGGIVSFWVADADSISSFPTPTGLIIPGNVTFTSGGWRKIVCTLYTANFTTEVSSNEQGLLATPQIQAIIPTDAPSIVSQLRDLSGKKLVVLTKTPSGLYQVVGRTDKWLTLSYGTDRQKSILERAQTTITLTGILPSPPLSYTGTITQSGTPIEADVISNYAGAVKLWVADAETVYTYPKTSGTMSDDITFIEPGGWLPISYTLYSHSFSQQHQTSPFSLETANISVEIPTDIADILFNAMKLNLRKLMAMIQIPSGERYVIGSPDKWLNAKNRQSRPGDVNNGATVGLQLTGTTMLPAVEYTGAIILGEDMNWAVCRKWQNIDTLLADYVTRNVEQIYALTTLQRLSGDKLSVSLYDTLVKAEAQTMDGLLAKGIANINNWLRRNFWLNGSEKALLFQAPLAGTGKAYFEYLAKPTFLNPCGLQDDVLGLSAYISYSSKKILNNIYDDLFYTTENGNNIIGNRLDALYDQSGKGINLIRPAAVNTTNRYHKIITDNIIKGGIDYPSEVNANVPIPFGLSNFTFFCRVRPKDGTVNDRQGVGLSISEGTIATFTSNIRILVLVQYNSPGNHSFQFRKVTGGGVSTIYTNIPLNSNTWYVLAVAYNWPTSTLKIYKDGTLIDTISTSLYTSFNVRACRLGITHGTTANSVPPLESTEHIFYEDNLNQAQITAVTDFLNT